MFITPEQTNEQREQMASIYEMLAKNLRAQIKREKNKVTIEICNCGPCPHHISGHTYRCSDVVDRCHITDIGNDPEPRNWVGPSGGIGKKVIPDFTCIPDWCPLLMDKEKN